MRDPKPQWSERIYLISYLVFGLALCLLIAIRLPIFMGPDELNHIKRADIVTRGELIGYRFESSGSAHSGGDVDPELDHADDLFESLKFHPKRKLTPNVLGQARKISWTDKQVRESFDNTASYPPFFYLPQSLGLELGRTAGLPILSTVELARVLNIGGCLILGAFAIVLAGPSRPFFAFVLLLPMSGMLASTVTQDGLLLGCAALASSLILRSLNGLPLTRHQMVSAAVCLTLVGIAKAPYVLLTLLLAGDRKRSGKVAALASLVTVLIWHLAITKWIQVPMTRPGMTLDPSQQLHHLLSHPLAFPTALAHTLRASGSEYVAQTIGILGWLDCPLPKLYYLTSIATLVALLTVSFRFGNKESHRATLIALSVLTPTLLGLFLTFYLAYTPIGGTIIEGLQGRYFLPLIVFLPLLLTPSAPLPGIRQHIKRSVEGLALAFPMLTFVVVNHAIANRYY